MRLYTFTNMYLSSLQNGLQTAHVIAELFNKYDLDAGSSVATDTLFNWACDHKTIIILNAGYSEEIRKLLHEFSTQHNYPWAPFYEGKDALDGALTCVGIILPERVYDGSKKIRELSVGQTISEWNTGLKDPFDLWMANQMADYSLAR